MWLTSWGSRTSKRGRVTGCQWVLYCGCSDAILFNIWGCFFLTRLIFQVFFPGNWNFIFFVRVTQICDSPGIIADKRHFRFFLTTGNWFDGPLGEFRFEFTFMAIILTLGVDFLLIHILLVFMSFCEITFIWFHLSNIKIIP